MIGLRPCLYACAYVDPDFTSQRCDISTSTSIRRTNSSVFLVLLLLLLSSQFSLASTCACAYAYGPSILFPHVVDNSLMPDSEVGFGLL